MLSGNVTIVDLIASILIIIGGVQGLIRGLSGEMAHLLGAICAFVGGALIHEPVGDWIASYTRLDDQGGRILTYIVTVILFLILWACFRRIIKKLLQLVLSVGFDKTAGLPAGMLRMATFVGIVFIAIHIWQAPFLEHVGEESFFGRQAIKLVPAVQRQLDAHNLNLQREPSAAGRMDTQQHKEEIEP